MGKHKTRKATLAALAALALLAGCGKSSTTPTTSQTPPASTPQAATSPPTGTHEATSTQADTSTQAPASRSEEKTPATGKIQITSPAVHEEGSLPARYTCDGQNMSLPLGFKGVPANTKELMLDVLKVEPVNSKFVFAWAVTHINPSTRQITGGKLPPGAVVGTNSEGHATYSLCPPKGKPEKYLAVVFALPHPIPAKTGFDPTQLRREALSDAEFENFLYFNYQRH